MIKAFAISVIVLASSPALAADVNFENEFGALLGAEEPCGMTFDKAAVQAYIEKHVDAHDIGFAPNVTMMAQGQKLQYDGLSESAQLVFCTQQRRVAKQFGFVK
jgi:hypothetical protein